MFISISTSRNRYSQLLFRSPLRIDFKTEECASANRSTNTSPFFAKKMLVRIESYREIFPSEKEEENVARIIYYLGFVAGLPYRYFASETVKRV